MWVILTDLTGVTENKQSIVKNHKLFPTAPRVITPSMDGKDHTRLK